MSGSAPGIEDDDLDWYDAELGWPIKVSAMAAEVKRLRAELAAERQVSDQRAGNIATLEAEVERLQAEGDRRFIARMGAIADKAMAARIPPHYAGGGVPDFRVPLSAAEVAATNAIQDSINDRIEVIGLRARVAELEARLAGVAAELNEADASVAAALGMTEHVPA